MPNSAFRRIAKGQFETRQRLDSYIRTGRVTEVATDGESCTVDFGFGAVYVGVTILRSPSWAGEAMGSVLTDDVGTGAVGQTGTAIGEWTLQGVAVDSLVRVQFDRGRTNVDAYVIGVLP